MSTIKNTLETFLDNNDLTCRSVTSSVEDSIDTGAALPLKTASRETLDAPRGGKTVIAYWKEDDWQLGGGQLIHAWRIDTSILLAVTINYPTFEEETGESDGEGTLTLWDFSDNSYPENAITRQIEALQSGIVTDHITPLRSNWVGIFQGQFVNAQKIVAEGIMQSLPAENKTQLLLHMQAQMASHLNHHLESQLMEAAPGLATMEIETSQEYDDMGAWFTSINNVSLTTTDNETLMFSHYEDWSEAAEYGTALEEFMAESKNPDTESGTDANAKALCNWLQEKFGSTDWPACWDCVWGLAEYGTDSSKRTFRDIDAPVTEGHDGD